MNIKKPKSIKPISDKRRKETKVYSTLREIYLSNHPECEIKLEGCTHISTDIHHLYSGMNRSKYFLNVSTWKSTCRSCHIKIHEMTEQDAVNKGLKLIDKS